MLILPTRWCIICIKRYLSVSILMIVCFTSGLSIVFYKWAELDAKLDCLKKNDGESPTTTHDNPVVSRAQQIQNGEMVTQNFANKSELRLKWLRQKVEKISQKVRRSQPIKLIDPDSESITSPNTNIHIFYYAWYGNVAVDGRWRHWNHEYLPNWKKEDKKIYPTGTHEPPSDISSNFYPMLGCYSSRDPAVIDTHMRQISEAKVDSLMPMLLDAAQRYDLRIAPHIEPYRDRNPINFSEHLRYIISQYGSHPALYRMQRRGRNLPVFYVYDSYLTPAGAWKELLSAKGNLSFYTYFATNGFTYGSSWKNWRSLGKFARQNGLLFVPSVGPGYIDTQIRPWNVANTRHRRHGKYFEVGWRSALSAQAKVVSITSFNEWHEGTQIEPAIPRAIASFTYFDYEPEGSNFYLNLTKWWVNEFSKKDQ
ncbi:hypothetical protein C0J52_10006 [Blattella germanica]|nr:hypothetical protein C0J52_10006 [Blattella germanica]